jgi:glutathione S-transferase
MRLYDYQLAPNPGRIRIFLAEKGSQCRPCRSICAAASNSRPSSARSTRNARFRCSSLMTAGASRGHRDLPLFRIGPSRAGADGVGAQDRAIVADWHHRIERQGFWAIADAFRNSAPGLVGRALPGPDDYEQIPALAERGRARTTRFFEMLDRHLSGRQFVASDRYTIADIMALVTLNFASRINLAIPEDCSHLRRWHETISARPSAAA